MIPFQPECVKGASNVDHLAATQTAAVLAELADEVRLSELSHNDGSSPADAHNAMYCVQPAGYCQKLKVPSYISLLTHNNLRLFEPYASRVQFVFT